jgi:hypothetical protein
VVDLVGDVDDDEWRISSAEKPFERPHFSRERAADRCAFWPPLDVRSAVAGVFCAASGLPADTAPAA